MTPIQAAIADLRSARASLADAAYHLGESGLEDSALLAEECDRLEQQARAVESSAASKIRNP